MMISGTSSGASARPAITDLPGSFFLASAYPAGVAITTVVITTSSASSPLSWNDTSHPEELSTSSYQRSENPLGGNASEAVELNELTTRTASGASRNANTSTAAAFGRTLRISVQPPFPRAEPQADRGHRQQRHGQQDQAQRRRDREVVDAGDLVVDRDPGERLVGPADKQRGDVHAHRQREHDQHAGGDARQAERERDAKERADAAGAQAPRRPFQRGVDAAQRRGERDDHEREQH